jgi:hypothetical protein
MIYYHRKIPIFVLDCTRIIVKIRIVNIRIGRLNSGSDLSGDTISPHSDEGEILEEMSLVELSGHE